MSGHTKGPWRQNVLLVQDADRNHIAHCTRWERGPMPDVAEANAAFIVRACNMHAELLAALHLAAEALDAYSDVNDGQDGPTANRAMAALQEIGIVLAKAEGKP